MHGKWVTKATGKTPPTGDLSGMNTQATILVHGKNSFGDPIYAYLQLPMSNIETVREALASGKNFFPSEYGTVVACGRGEPSQEVQDEIGKTHFLVYFEPKKLPNLPDKKA